jgi:hypothetical protein
LESATELPPRRSRDLSPRTPVRLNLIHGDQHSSCLARLVWDGPRLFAEPFKPDQAKQPWRWRRIELNPNFVSGPSWSVLGIGANRYLLPVPMG